MVSRRKKSFPAFDHRLLAMSVNQDIRGKIIEALNNRKYQARTITGIAKEAGTTKEMVLKILRTDPELRQMIKIYPRRLSDGRILLTTKRRFSEESSLRDKFVDIFSTTRTSLDDVG